MKVLIFADERGQLEFDAFVLRQAGFQPVSAATEERLLSASREENPEVIVVDVTSRDIDLLSLVGQLRSEWDGPLMVISPVMDEEYIISALDQGVDDYLIKPHGPHMLAARVRALLRHTRAMPLSALGPITIQGLTLDPEQHLVTTPTGSSVHLTNMEFRLLFLLMRNPDRVIPLETIVQRVWGFSGQGEATLVKSLISRLRHKVEPDPAHPRYVKTVPGIGYSFSPVDDAETG
jgi:two-component system KDP operon response regulator KdpE